MGKQIAVDQIADGMVLSGDAQTPDGNVLLAAGTALTARHKSLLEKRGVTHIFIVDPEAPPAGDGVSDGAVAPVEEEGEPPSPAVQLAREHLNSVFADVRGDALMEQILELAKERAEHIEI